MCLSYERKLKKLENKYVEFACLMQQKNLHTFEVSFVSQNHFISHSKTSQKSYKTYHSPPTCNFDVHSLRPIMPSLCRPTVVCDRPNNLCPLGHCMSHSLLCTAIEAQARQKKATSELTTFSLNQNSCWSRNALSQLVDWKTRQGMHTCMHHVWGATRHKCLLKVKLGQLNCLFSLFIRRHMTNNEMRTSSRSFHQFEILK